MDSVEPCISVGRLLQGENRCGNSWELFTTTNPPLYSGSTFPTFPSFFLSNIHCRISKLKSSDENLNVTASFMSLGSQRKNAMVGISVEPLVNIQGQTPAAQTEAVKVSTFMEFGQKMVENLFNFASSFAVSGGEMRSRSAETFVPFSCLQQWYNNFERRLQHDPNFWRK